MNNRIAFRYVVTTNNDKEYVTSSLPYDNKRDAFKMMFNAAVTRLKRDTERANGCCTITTFNVIDKERIEYTNPAGDTFTFKLIGIPPIDINVDKYKSDAMNLKEGMCKTIFDFIKAYGKKQEDGSLSFGLLGLASPFYHQSHFMQVISIGINDSFKEGYFQYFITNDVVETKYKTSIENLSIDEALYIITLLNKVVETDLEDAFKNE